MTTNLPAGPELDRLVAERVMGGLVDRTPSGTVERLDPFWWHPEDKLVFRGHPWQFDAETDPERRWFYQWEPFRPSTSIAVDFDLNDYKHDGKRGWTANIGNQSLNDFADTAPRVICLAALRAVGGA